MAFWRRQILALARSGVGVRWSPGLAQTASSLPVVAVLLPNTAEFSGPRLDAIRTGLCQAGFVEGTDFALIPRMAQGHPDRLPGLARELQSLRPAVFIGAGSLTAALELQPRPPMVFTAIAVDPVRWGIVDSYARPGGMLTGNVLTALGGEDTIAERRLALFKELVPGLRRLGIIGANAAAGARANLFEEEVVAAKKVADRQGFEVEVFTLRSIDEIEDTVASSQRAGIDVIAVSGMPLLIGSLPRVMPPLLATGLPTLGTYADWARAGALMSYSADLLDGFRHAGFYAGKILRGANPGELPIEQPTKFTLAINMATARKLGVTVPVALEAMADELIDEGAPR